MRNLWIFISKYSAFFLFILFFSLSLILIIQKNSYQRTSVLNSSNYFIGNLYSKVNNLKNYLNLNEDNLLLSNENALLREQLVNAKYSNELITGEVLDSLQEQRYTFTEAKVINNSINLKNNVFTINRGRKHGVKRGMGVIGSTGVAGIVLNVSEHFATVQSFLNPDTKISASLDYSKSYGSLVWGENNFNPKIARLRDIPNHVKVSNGEKVYTSGYSLFPQGILLGKVINSEQESSDSFLDINIELEIDFSSLQYVYVVTDNMADEKAELEKMSKENG